MLGASHDTYLASSTSRSRGLIPPNIADTEDYYSIYFTIHLTVTRLRRAPTRRSSHLERRDAPTATTTATTTSTTTTTCARRIARRGYADPLGTDDARHHIARRIRDVTVRALETYVLHLLAKSARRRLRCPDIHTRPMRICQCDE